MEQIKYARVPLNEEERDLLLEVYKKRARSYAAGYSFFLIASLFLHVRGMNSIFYYLDDLDHYWAMKNKDGLSMGLLWVIKVVEIQCMFLIPASILFYRNVFPLKKDAASGEKERIPYIITRKEYFEYTGQYYFALDDPFYLHHEVEPEVYNSYSEGDVYYVYKGIYSKFAFEKDGRYTL